MQKIHKIIDIVDWSIGTFWGFSLIETLSFIASGARVFEMPSLILTNLFTLVGIIYAIFKIINYRISSKLDNELKRQAILKMELELEKQGGQGKNNKK